MIYEVQTGGEGQTGMPDGCNLLNNRVGGQRGRCIIHSRNYRQMEEGQRNKCMMD